MQYIKGDKAKAKAIIKSRLRALLTNTDHDRKHSLLIDSGAGYQARRHWNSMNSMSALQDADLGMQCPQPAIC